MTTPDLPPWAVEQCLAAYAARYQHYDPNEDQLEGCVVAALTAFLTLLEERGLRVVPESMIAEALSKLAPIGLGWWTGHYHAKELEYSLTNIPPLAELLAEPEAPNGP